MRSFTARHLALAALVPALFLLSVIPGCSNESEGERCEGPMNSDDCESGLVCTEISDENNRCCYPDHVTDSRCSRAGSGSATSDGGLGEGGQGEGGMAGDGAAVSSSEAGSGGMSIATAGAGGN